MTFKERMLKSLTPSDTEEIKPGLFIQEKKGKNGISLYRQINPVAWNGKFRLKSQFSWKNLFVIAIIIFLAWSYTHDIQALKDFQKKVTNHKFEWCSGISIEELEVDNGNTSTLFINNAGTK